MSKSEDKMPVAQIDDKDLEHVRGGAWSLIGLSGEAAGSAHSATLTGATILPELEPDGSPQRSKLLRK